MGREAALLSVRNVGMSHSPMMGSESDRTGDRGVAVETELSGDSGDTECVRGGSLDVDREAFRLIFIVAEEAIVALTPGPAAMEDMGSGDVEGLLPSVGAR